MAGTTHILNRMSNLNVRFLLLISFCPSTVPMKSLHPLDCFPIVLFLYMESWSTKIYKTKKIQKNTIDDKKDFYKVMCIS